MILKLDELETIANEIKLLLPEGGVVILEGDLAAGKTTLVKSVVKSFGVDEDVSSPTFSLQQCYAESIFHYDIYNHGFEHFVSLGMFEELEKEGYHFVEWGDEKLMQLLKLSAIPTIHILIEFIDENRRSYTITKVA